MKTKFGKNCIKKYEVIQVSFSNAVCFMEKRFIVKLIHKCRYSVSYSGRFNKHLYFFITTAGFFLQLDDWYYKFEFAAYTMAYSNSALNPLIYAGFNENFKQGKR